MAKDRFFHNLRSSLLIVFMISGIAVVVNASIFMYEAIQYFLVATTFISVALSTFFYGFTTKAIERFDKSQERYKRRREGMASDGGEAETDKNIEALAQLTEKPHMILNEIIEASSLLLAIFLLYVSLEFIFSGFWFMKIILAVFIMLLPYYWGLWLAKKLIKQKDLV